MRKIISKQDFILLFVLPLLILISLIFGPRIARTFLIFFGEKRKILNEILRSRPSTEPRHFNHYLEKTNLLAKQQLIFGLYSIFRPLNVSYKCFFSEYLKKAARENQSAVLLVSNTAYANLTLKKILFDLGVTPTHLSSAGHGVSSTSFGKAFLNKVVTIPENKYLRKRVIYDRSKPFSTCAALKNELGGGGIVTILAIPQEGKRSFRASISENVSYKIPIGPAWLAIETRSKFFGVFAARRDESRLFVYFKEIETKSKSPSELIEEYSKIELDFVRRYPDQWLGWRYASATNAERV